MPSLASMPQAQLFQRIFILLYIYALLACSNSITVVAVAVRAVAIKARPHIGKHHDPNRVSALVKNEERFLDLPHISDSFYEAKLTQKAKALLKNSEFVKMYDELRKEAGFSVHTSNIAIPLPQHPISNQELAEMLYAAKERVQDVLKVPLFKKWSLHFGAEDMFFELRLDVDKFHYEFVHNPKFTIWVEYAQYLNLSVKEILDVIGKHFNLEYFLLRILEDYPVPKAKTVLTTLAEEMLSKRVVEPLSPQKTHMDVYDYLISVKEERVENHFLRPGAPWFVEYARMHELTNWPHEVIKHIQFDYNIPTSNLVQWAVEAESYSQFETVGEGIIGEFLKTWKGGIEGFVKRKAQTFEDVQRILHLHEADASQVVDNGATKVLVQYMFTTFGQAVAVKELSEKLPSWLGNHEFYRLLSNYGKWPLNSEMSGWLESLNHHVFNKVLYEAHQKVNPKPLHLRLLDKPREMFKLNPLSNPLRDADIPRCLEQIFRDLKLDEFKDDLFALPEYAFFARLTRSLEQRGVSYLFIRDKLVKQFSREKYDQLVFNALTNPTDQPTFRRAAELEFESWHWQRIQPSETELLKKLSTSEELVKCKTKVLQEYDNWINRRGFHDGRPTPIS